MSFHKFCSYWQAQPQLNFNFNWGWVGFISIWSSNPPTHPPTRPPGHPQEKFQLKLEMSQIKRDWFKTTLWLLQANLYKTSNWLKNTLTLRSLQCLKIWLYQPELPSLASIQFNFNPTLMVGSWDPLEQIPTVILTFVQATVVLATIVHIRNISAVTGLILTKL